MLTNAEIQAQANERAADYKPWSDDCVPQDYFNYGFVQGAHWARDVIKSELLDIGRAEANRILAHVAQFGTRGFSARQLDSAWKVIRESHHE